MDRGNAGWDNRLGAIGWVGEYGGGNRLGGAIHGGGDRLGGAIGWVGQYTVGVIGWVGQ